MHTLYICLAALCLLPGPSRAEENTSVLVQNYTINDYRASCQNWDIAISYRGLLYVANNSGLLEFDGNTWTLYPLPDRSRLFRLSFSNDTVYSRGESGDGYWMHDEMGRMHFTPVDEPYPQSYFREDSIPSGLSPEIQADKPLAYASTHRLDLIGTERGGLYITDKEGRVVHHIEAPGLLQDNMVYDISVQDDNLVWLAYFAVRVLLIEQVHSIERHAHIFPVRSPVEEVEISRRKMHCALSRRDNGAFFPTFLEPQSAYQTR